MTISQLSRQLMCVAVLILLVVPLLSQDCDGHCSNASCSFCICCHGAIVVHPIAATFAANIDRPIKIIEVRFPLDPIISPFDQPPRTVQPRSQPQSN
jgi:hypothetical protein